MEIPGLHELTRCARLRSMLTVSELNTLFDGHPCFFDRGRPPGTLGFNQGNESPTGGAWLRLAPAEVCTPLLRIPHLAARGLLYFHPEGSKALGRGEGNRTV